MESQVGKCLTIKKALFVHLSILNPFNLPTKYFCPLVLLLFYRCGGITLLLFGAVGLKKRND